MRGMRTRWIGAALCAALSCAPGPALAQGGPIHELRIVAAPQHEREPLRRELRARLALLRACEPAPPRFP